MKRKLFPTFIFLLYIGGLSFAGFVAWQGYSYYKTPFVDRPHAAMHEAFRPSGSVGHGLGILGSLMLLLLFLYSARKRQLFGLRWGATRRWLDIHIFFGILGPILITLHTSMKFGGIVSISYFSMLAVMFSGVFGRYIYMQIPRNMSGTSLNLQQINALDNMITGKMVDEYRFSPGMLERLDRLSGAHLASSIPGWLTIFVSLYIDMTMPWRRRSMKKLIRKQKQDISDSVLNEMLAITNQKSQLLRKRAFLNSMNAIFHLWHVIHKPFAYVMIIIMFVHIIVAVAFGYRWVL